jgi:hypothetical protein
MLNFRWIGLRNIVLSTLTQWRGTDIIAILFYAYIIIKYYKILYTCYHLWATAKTSAIGTPFWGRTSWFSIFFKYEVSHESFPDSNIRGERDGTFPNLCPFQSPWVHPCFTGISKSAAAKHGTPAISQIFFCQGSKIHWLWSLGWCPSSLSWTKWRSGLR